VNDGPFWFDTYATRNGVKVPNWKQRIEQGLDATSPFTATRGFFERHFRESWRWEVSPTYPSGRRTTYGQGYAAIIHAIQAANRGSLSVDETKANNEALKKVYRKIREHRTQLQGLTVLGELRKTIEGIRKPGIAARKLLEGHIVRCGKATKKFSRPGDVAKAFSGSWLETQYGLKPLLQDVESAAEALADVITEKIPNYRLKCSGVDSAVRVYSGVHQNQWAWNDRGIRQVIVIYTVGLRQEYSDAGKSRAAVWADRFGFRLDEFAPTLWELAPWSFLWDYFTNIGDLVDAASTSTDKVIYTNKTVVNRTRWFFDCHLDYASIKKADNGWSSQLLVDGPNQQIITETRSVNRGPAILGLPSFQLSLPSAHQWTNIGALIIQATAVTGKPQTLRRAPREPVKAWDVGSVYAR